MQIQASKLLIGTLSAAVTATVALILAYAPLLSTVPPAGGGPGAPPPPPRLDSIATVVVLTGVCVVAWMGVIVVLALEQVLREVQELPVLSGSEPSDLGQQLGQAVAALRRDLADDQRAGMRVLEERLTALTAEYGEQRETDGYISGMRVATTAGQERGELRQIRPVRPAP
jgi:hypothetical protein